MTPLAVHKKFRRRISVFLCAYTVGKTWRMLHSFIPKWAADCETWWAVWRGWALAWRRRCLSGATSRYLLPTPTSCLWGWCGPFPIVVDDLDLDGPRIHWLYVQTLMWDELASVYSVSSVALAGRTEFICKHNFTDMWINRHWTRCIRKHNAFWDITRIQHVCEKPCQCRRATHS